jgi:hypothetical protein
MQLNSLSLYGTACLLATFSLTPLRAGDKAIEAVVSESGPSVEVTHDLKADYSYVGEADFKNGGGKSRGFDEHATSLEYIATVQAGKYTYLRGGVASEEIFFNGSSGVPVPDMLEATNLVIGVDTALSEHWLIRFQIMPGIYSDMADVTWNDANIPMMLGFSYLVSDKLQFMGGIRFDMNAGMPVMGGVGVRWKFADQWTLNAVLPKPRLEYDVTDQIKLYAGASFMGGTYRVGEHLGDREDLEKLNGTVVDYTEIRTGLGLEWKLAPAVTLGIEGGYVPSRELDYHRADYKVEGEGAAYGQIGASARF